LLPTGSVLPAASGYVSSRDEGEVHASHSSTHVEYINNRSAKDWLDQGLHELAANAADGLPAASGHVSGRDEGEVHSSHSSIHVEYINNRSAEDWLDQGLHELAADAVAVGQRILALEKFKQKYPRLHSVFISQDKFDKMYLDINALSSDMPSVCASIPYGCPAYLVCVGGAPTSEVMIAFDYPDLELGESVT
jgi:hypothetical protein